MAGLMDYREVRAELDKLKSKYLLLGNGFSIALFPKIFTYESLFEHADFSEAPHLQDLFKVLGTMDFEIVIQKLVSAAGILSIYAPDEKDLIATLQKDADFLKGVLVKAIAGRHPDRPMDIKPEQYAACRSFLQPFGHIFTLNYDVVLYWTLMQDEVDKIDLRPDDGFREPEEENQPYVSWQDSQSASVNFLHGALHLFDARSEIIKYTWSRTNIPIVEQIREALDNDRYPIFVSEGSSDSKLEKIMHNAYLHKAQRSFEGCMAQPAGAVVVYGHSLAENDQHILKIIARGRIGTMFVSIYGDPDSGDNKKILVAAEALAALRRKRNGRYPLKVVPFDAASAHVWG